MRTVGDRVIIAPPLVMTTADIDEMIRLIRLALGLTYKDLKESIDCYKQYFVILVRFLLALNYCFSTFQRL